MYLKVLFHPKPVSQFRCFVFSKVKGIISVNFCYLKRLAYKTHYEKLFII